MTVKIKRLFHGFASVRSTQVERAKRKGEGLYIIYGDKHMTVPFEKLDKGFSNREEYQSKHDGSWYSLVDYDFKEDPSQQSLFEPYVREWMNE